MKWRVEQRNGYYFVSKRFLWWWRVHVWTFTLKQAYEYINEQEQKKTSRFRNRKETPTT